MPHALQCTVSEDDISEEERYSISDLDQVSYATVSDDDISEEERFNFGL